MIKENMFELTDDVYKYYCKFMTYKAHDIKTRVTRFNRDVITKKLNEILLTGKWFIQETRYIIECQTMKFTIDIHKRLITNIEIL